MLNIAQTKGWSNEWQFASTDLYVIPENLIYEIFGGMVYSEA